VQRCEIAAIFANPTGFNYKTLTYDPFSLELFNVYSTLLQAFRTPLRKNVISANNKIIFITKNTKLYPNFDRCYTARGPVCDRHCGLDPQSPALYRGIPAFAGMTRLRCRVVARRVSTEVHSVH
jgi:hypothetical protein